MFSGPCSIGGLFRSPSRDRTSSKVDILTNHDVRQSLPSDRVVIVKSTTMTAVFLVFMSAALVMISTGKISFRTFDTNSCSSFFQKQRLEYHRIRYDLKQSCGQIAKPNDSFAGKTTTHSSRRGLDAYDLGTAHRRVPLNFSHTLRALEEP